MNPSRVGGRAWPSRRARPWLTALLEGRGALPGTVAYFAPRSVSSRLFYVSSEKSTNEDTFLHNDGVQLRSSLRNAIGFKFDKRLPAISVIPVKAIDTIDFVPKDTDDSNRVIKFAMQVLLLDPVHFETEIWIHKDR